MHQGNWTCSGCGGAITELPFEPRSSAGLTCRNCYFKKKDGQAGASAPAAAHASAADVAAAGEMDDREVPPFNPDEAAVASEPAPESPDMAAAPVAGEKKMFTGDWQCATCSGSITELPFQPRDTSNLKCRDCFMKEKRG